jgi:hypothetical protein
MGNGYGVFGSSYDPSLLPVLIAAAIQTRNDWKTEKIDQRLFIEIGPLF